MFKYNQLSSDFSNPIVREARGIIFREDNWKCVRRAFDKFFNYGEPNAADVDWSTAKVQTKIDGSLVSAWFDDEKWHYSTNGTIDIYKAPTGDIKLPTFGEVLEEAFRNNGISEEIFEQSASKLVCYTFELVSPQTRVVIPYEKPDLYFIGYRTMMTEREMNPKESIVSEFFKTPKEYDFHSAQDVIDAAKDLPWDEEGYVVVDSKFRRVKIKSPAYVMAHYARNNNVITPRALLEVVFAGEQKEFLVYSSDYAQELEKVERAYHYVIDELYHAKCAIRPEDYPDRKEYAAAVKRQDGWKQGFLFAPETDAESWARKNWPSRKWVDLFEQLHLI